MDWKYIAGFFDGEGSLSPNGKGYRVTVPQTNRQVLEEIKNYSGVGIIFKEKKRKKHWKDAWVYYIAKQSDIYIFLIRIQPFCLVKNTLINKTLPKIKCALKIQKKKKKNLIKVQEKAKIARMMGLTYRQIGKKLKIDYGYARRLILKEN